MRLFPELKKTQTEAIVSKFYNVSYKRSKVNKKAKQAYPCASAKARSWTCELVCCLVAICERLWRHSIRQSEFWSNDYKLTVGKSQTTAGQSQSTAGRLWTTGGQSQSIAITPYYIIHFDVLYSDTRVRKFGNSSVLQFEIKSEKFKINRKKWKKSEKKFKLN